jgi:hypothetical protein
MAGGTGSPNDVKAFGINEPGLQVNAVDNFILADLGSIVIAFWPVGILFHSNRLITVSIDQVWAKKKVEKRSGDDYQYKIKEAK